MKVIFCLPGISYTAPFFTSWNRLMFWMKDNNIMPILGLASGSNVSKVRDRCLRPPRLTNEPVPNPRWPLYGKVDYDYIMWIDSDMSFMPEDFKKLLDRKVDIVCGAYKMDPANYAGVLLDKAQKFDDIEYVTEQDLGGKDLLEALFFGMGFMLVKKNVFETIPWPWFPTDTVPVLDNPEVFAGEDTYFCVKARESGFKVWLDPTVRVGHQRHIVI